MFTGNAINDAGATSLGEALKINATLTKLGLNCTQQEMINHLSGFFKSFITHKPIDVTANFISGTGLKSFCEGWKCNTTLTILNLKGLKTNRTISLQIHVFVITFSSFSFKQIDPIGGLGATSLSEIINVKNTLTKLCLICELINNTFPINPISDSFHFCSQSVILKRKEQ